MSKVPTTLTGTVPVTLTPPAGFVQFLIENTSATSVMRAKINGDLVGKTVDSGRNFSGRINSGVYQIVLEVISGTPTYEVWLA